MKALKGDRLTGHTIIIVFLVLAAFLSSCRTNSSQKVNYPDISTKIIDHAAELGTTETPQRAISYLDSAYHRFPTAGPEDLWKKYRFKFEYYLYHEYTPTLLRNVIDSMYTVLGGENGPYKELYAQTYFSEGDALMTERLYSEAFDRYYRGKDFAKKHLDSCKYSTFSYGLGIVRYKQEQYEEANVMFREFLTENSRCRSGFNERLMLPYNALNAMALCFEKLGKLDSALVYYQKSLSFLEHRAPEFLPEKASYFERARGVVYGNMGGAYRKLGNANLAELYLKKSIQINKRPGYEMPDALTAEIKLAELYLQSKQYAKADSTLWQIQAGINKLRHMKRQVGSSLLPYYRLSWALADSLGDSGRAYQFLKSYQLLQDSIASVNAKKQPKDMGSVFQLKDQQYQLTLLEKDNKIAQQTLMMVAGFSAMFALLLGVVWVNYRRSSKQVNELTRLNQLIGDQNIHMQEALRDLEQSQEDNSRLLRIVAHDLRSPISSIASCISLLQSDNLTNEERMEFLKMIQNACANTLAFTNDLLQTHSQKKQLQLSPINLRRILQDCIDVLQPRAHSKQQHIEFEGDDLVVLGSSEKIWRVVSNLITNAIKFSTYEAIIKVQLSQEGDNARIAVTDQGIGIPEDLKNKLFSTTGEIGRVGTDGEESFGLGLAISKQIVNAHGGHIWFESQQEQGTVFFVELPLPQNHQ